MALASAKTTLHRDTTNAMQAALNISQKNDRHHDQQRIAVAFPCRPSAPPHEMASHNCLTRKLAKLLGLHFIEGYSPDTHEEIAGIYYLPADTLVTTAISGHTAPLPGVRTERDLFGGMAPYPFVGTKAITHPLVHANAKAPNGWSSLFGAAVKDAVLRGVTAFTADDAISAGQKLLSHGAVRIKSVNGSGGRGQCTVRNRTHLIEFIEQHDLGELASAGLVLEEHLDNVETYSVGRIQVGGLIASYVGTQALTPDNAGNLVYGGSELRLVRGDWDALLTLECTQAERKAVELARIYDEAAFRCYPSLYASRRNYDVACGLDGAGKPCFGVLEQSWRMGGASFAEACALEFFAAEPEAQAVRAFTVERFGPGHQAPPTAQLIYQNKDPHVGLITKYGGISSI